MAIVRWEPFRDLVSTQDRFNRLFNDTFTRLFDGSEGETRGWAPAVDVHETAHELVLTADLPGVDPKDVEIRVENGTLFVKGERKFEKTNDKGYLQVERVYGTFTRTFSLPPSINPENVTANYKNGVLTVTLPKREEAKPKSIKINVNSEARAEAATAR
jgi:HSP20 family protein